MLRSCVLTSAFLILTPNFLKAQGLDGSIIRRSQVVSSTFSSAGLSGTTANTALGGCGMASSTSTFNIPAAGGRAILNVTGTASVNSLAAVMQVGFVVDGLLIANESAAKGCTAPMEAVSTDGTSISCSALITGLSAANHTVCLTLATSAGTLTIDSTNSTMLLWGYTLP